MDAYEPADEDELALEVGKILQIKQKNIDGWWLVRLVIDLIYSE